MDGEYKIDAKVDRVTRFHARGSGEAGRGGEEEGEIPRCTKITEAVGMTARFLPVLNYWPLFGQVRKILPRTRPRDLTVGSPLPGQRIKARCTDDHRLTFALSSHFPFAAASSPALAEVTRRPRSVSVQGARNLSSAITRNTREILSLRSAHAPPHPT